MITPLHLPPPYDVRRRSCVKRGGEPGTVRATASFFLRAHDDRPQCRWPRCERSSFMMSVDICHQPLPRGAAVRLMIPDLKRSSETRATRGPHPCSSRVSKTDPLPVW